MIDFLLNDFIGRAILAGIGLTIPLAFVGCFLLWRRMVFLSDTMGHGAILGIALGTWFHLDMTLSVIGLSLLVALILSRRKESSYLAVDTWMSVLSYGGLALGLILLSKNTGNPIEPDSILFGDVLAMGPQDLVWIYGVAMAILLFAWRFWRPWLLITLDEDLASTTGLPIGTLRRLFTLCVALVIAIGLKVVGALLLPALMVIPAAAAGRFARSPEVMVGVASLFTLLSYMGGLGASFHFDTPTGPTIAVTSIILLLVSQSKKMG